MSTRPLAPRSSVVDVDESSVFRLLLEEHRDGLSGARSVLARMLQNDGVRDIDGLNKLERLFSLVKASASYLGLSLLREVVIEADRVVDRLRMPGTKHSRQASEALQEALEFVAASLAYARSNKRTPDHQERGVRALKALAACELTPVSLLPAELTDQELFAEDARRHVELCREAVVRASDDPGQRTDAIHAAFRAMHTLKGNAAMMGFAELESLGRAAESVLEGLRAGELTLTVNVTVALLNLLEKAGLAIARPLAFRWQREAEALDVAAAEARIVARRTRIGSLLVEHNFVSREQVDLVLAIKREPLGQALILLNALNDQQLQQVLEIQHKLRAGEDPPELPTTPLVESSVNVDPFKLKQLKRSMERMRRAAFDAAPAVREAVCQLEAALGTLDHVPLGGISPGFAADAGSLRQAEQAAVREHVRRRAGGGSARSLVHLRYAAAPWPQRSGPWPGVRDRAGDLRKARGRTDLARGAPGRARSANRSDRRWPRPAARGHPEQGRGAVAGGHRGGASHVRRAGVRAGLCAGLLDCHAPDRHLGAWCGHGRGEALC